MDNKMVEVGGVWERTSKNGKMYLWMKLDASKITNAGNLIAFENSYKEEGDKKPTYKVFQGSDRGQS